MSTSNDTGRRRFRASRLAGSALLGILAVTGSSCAGRETATFRRNVRLDVSHESPGAAPAGRAFPLGIRVVADPPLPPGSAHLWYDAGEGWVRTALQPLPDTDSLVAEIPAQPRGREVRYAFTVRTALGETIRLPREGAPGRAAATRSATDPSVGAPETPSPGAPVAPVAPGEGLAPSRETDVYRLPVRAPAATWARAMRAIGFVLAMSLVGSGTVLAFRWRPSDPPRRRPLGVVVIAVGVLAYLFGLAGAVTTSFQSTGDALRDVPLPWWVGLALWLPVFPLANASRRPVGLASHPRRLAILSAVLGAAGALAVLAGIGRFL